MTFLLRTPIIQGCLWLFFLSLQSFAATNIMVRDVGADTDFPEGAEAGAIRFVCAQSEDDLTLFFSSRGLPFEPSLIKSTGGQKCHIWYEPTLKGFRASTENDQVQGLMFDVDALSLLLTRTEVIGDSLDVVRAMLPHISRPLKITLGVDNYWKKGRYEEALKLYFQELYHSIEFHETKSRASNPWTQDYIKGGKVGNKPFILIPRRLMEGSVEYGEVFLPFLDELTHGSFVRSKLSWEGGDIMFLRHPRNPSQTLLFFGDAAKKYWGKQLTDEEYAYVLKIEFGADHAVNLSGLAAHIDYLVSFIPEDNIALVSDPITRNQGLAYAALETLGQRLETPYTMETVEMAKALWVSDAEYRENSKQLRALMDNLKARQSILPVEKKIGLEERLDLYISQNCSDDPSACFTGEILREMGRKDLPLLREWISSAAVLRIDVAQIPALLSVIESQLPDHEIPDRQLREKKIAELEALGLKVIRVPGIAGDTSLNVPWSGISYVNNILVDNVLFIPVLGMPDIEELFLENLRDQLPSGYRIVPIFARDLILNSGGIHCATGIIRAM